MFGCVRSMRALCAVLIVWTSGSVRLSSSRRIYIIDTFVDVRGNVGKCVCGSIYVRMHTSMITSLVCTVRFITLQGACRVLDNVGVIYESGVAAGCVTFIVLVVIVADTLAYC